MAIRDDRRPTLASWPRCIQAWEELPPPFRPALEAWAAQGLPPQHVIHIPRVHQYAGGPEYAAAWWGDSVSLQTLRQGRLTGREIRPGETVQLRYQVRLLCCDVTACLRDGSQVSFSYNKTREDQLLPLLNLLLGNPPDFRPAADHPETPEWAQLRRDSYAMYFTSLLCCRYGGPPRAHLWFRGRERSLVYFLRKMPQPEYFLAAADRGLVVLSTDFYGTRAVYLPWEEVRIAPPADGDAALSITPAHGEGLSLPLLPGQAAQVRAFLQAAREAVPC